MKLHNVGIAYSTDNLDEPATAPWAIPKKKIENQRIKRNKPANRVVRGMKELPQPLLLSLVAEHRVEESDLDSCRVD